ncbi:MAG: hypothetical protein ABF649_19815 [Bacillus sp. (in: firmicutes)]
MKKIHETQTNEDLTNQQDNDVFVPPELDALAKSTSSKMVTNYDIKSLPKPLKIIGYIILSFLVFTAIACIVLTIFF